MKQTLLILASFHAAVLIATSLADTADQPVAAQTADTSDVLAIPTDLENPAISTGDPAGVILVGHSHGL